MAVRNLPWRRCFGYCSCVPDSRRKPCNCSCSRMTGSATPGWISAWPSRRLAVEADGRETHDKPEALYQDRVRQNNLVLAGWTVLRFTWDDVHRRPHWVLAQIGAALQKLRLAHAFDPEKGAQVEIIGRLGEGDEVGEVVGPVVLDAVGQQQDLLGRAGPRRRPRRGSRGRRRPGRSVSARSTSAREAGSRLLVGSSSSKTLALLETRIANASRVFSPPDSVPAGCSTVSPENRNAPRTRRSSGSGVPGEAARTLSMHRAVRVERLVLLRVVADAQPEARLDLAGVGDLHTRQHAQQRGLAGTVQAEDDDPAAAVDREVDIGENLKRAIGFRQFGRSQRGLAAGRRLGETQLGDLVGLTARPRARTASSRRASACSARPWPWSPWPASGRPARSARRPCFSALARSRLRRRSSVSRCCEVALPADVVDVDDGPGGIEMEDAIDRRLEQLDVVADDHQPARVRAQEVTQPDDRVGVEVVGRLVEQQRAALTGSLNRIRASSTRRRWPPESVRNGCSSARSGSPRFAAIRAASASAAYPPSDVKRSSSRP